MADTLVIIPTKGRPHRIPPLLEAIRRTAVNVDVMLVINEGDWPSYNGIEGEHRDVLVSDEDRYPDKLNIAASYAYGLVGYRYLVPMNDDHEPITPGWDVKMREALENDRFGIAYGPDGIWEDGRIPSAPMITMTMFSTLGYIALPGLNHILVDNVWYDLAEATGTRHFLPDVRIQHHHYTMGTAPLDDTYKETSNQARQDEDSKTYWDWFNHGKMNDDIARLKALSA